MSEKEREAIVRFRKMQSTMCHSHLARKVRVGVVKDAEMRQDQGPDRADQRDGLCLSVGTSRPAGKVHDVRHDREAVDHGHNLVVEVVVSPLRGRVRRKWGG